jgi:serine/threonine protein kinase
MAEQEHANLRRVFDLAMAAAPADRGPLLDRECGGDAGLRRRIEGMVAAAEDERFLGSPTGGRQGALGAGETLETAAASMAERPGMRIGPYKVLQLIGEGGFGSVFMAEQEKPVARKVALKIIKLGMDTRQVVARFEQERQALAMMDHPHIARVLDAGATEAGRPYFVMDLVKGDPIAEYCDKNNLSVHDRLELFAQVCNAVQHAHQKGIIHRDIKPSNILVTTQDGKPHAKVIDFGIAKATASKLTEKTLFTEHRALIGTPEYMSPEQAEGSLDIDTRTDVYSLGVLLYELLTGSTPFSGRDLRSAAYAEIQRIIREVEPPKPSTRISQNTETIANVASRRHTEPKQLGSMVRGELDWIVMRALEKDRQRRYETANGLALDIRRYLDGEAVLAAPPSTAYRFKKFIRRNRVMVTSGGAVAASLLIGVVAFAWQAKVASDQRDIAVASQHAEAEQRKQAEAARAEALAQQARAEAQEAEARKQEAEAKKQAAIAKAVAKFQTDMLGAANPWNMPTDPVTKEPLKDKVTVVQAIEAAVKLLDEGSLKDQPLVEAGVRGIIGNTLSNLRSLDAAEPHLRKALELHRANLPAGHLELADSLSVLGTHLLHAGKVAEADPLFREALAIRRAALPAGHPDIALGLDGLARLLQAQNKLAEAEPLHREALAISRAAHPGRNPEFVFVNNLASCLEFQGKIGEAEQLYREGLAIVRAAVPARPLSIAGALNNLGRLLLNQQRASEAELLIREALAIHREVLPDGNPYLEASITGLAWLLNADNRLAEAELLFREALTIVRSTYPVGHPYIANALNNLGDLLRSRNRTDEAEPLLREAVAILRAAPPDGAGSIARSLNILALLLQDQGKFAEAEPLYREALAITRAQLPAGHPYIPYALAHLALVLLDQNKLAEAEPLFLEAVEIARAAHPAGHLSIGPRVSNLGSLRMAQNRPAEAEPLFGEALAINRAALPEMHPDIALALSNLARAHQALGKFAEARAEWDEAIAMFRKCSPDGSAMFARVLWRSGSARLENKDAAAALAELEESVAMAERFLPATSPFLQEHRETLAKCRAAISQQRPQVDP